jgi:hypothetical protein
MTDNDRVMLYRIDRLEAELSKAEKDIADLRSEADSRERGYYRAGVVFLGGVVLALIGVVWANLGAYLAGR